MSASPKSSDRVQIRGVETLSDEWYVLQKYTFGFHRRDGTWEELRREVCHRGDSAVVLLFCPERGTVLLTRQFRLPVYVKGGSDGMLVEAPGGLIDGDSPEAAIRREAEEETGYRITELEKAFAAYMTPTLVTERVHFFVAEFDPDARASSGGGCAAEGEDIETLEVPFEEALAMIEAGAIEDAKTILLLHYAKLKELLRRRPPLRAKAR